MTKILPDTPAPNPQLPIPNPHDWTDTAGAADMMGISRSTVYDYVDRGILHKYRVGATTLYWWPEVREVAEALRRLRTRPDAPGGVR